MTPPPANKMQRYSKSLFRKKRDGINPQKTNRSKVHLFRFLFLSKGFSKEGHLIFAGRQACLLLLISPLNQIIMILEICLPIPSARRLDAFFKTNEHFEIYPSFSLYSLVFKSSYAIAKIEYDGEEMNLKELFWIGYHTGVGRE